MNCNIKKVTLFKNFTPDHNGECLNCDCWLSDCECLYLMSNEETIATPDQINLSKKEQQNIFLNNGECFIEMDVFEGDGCGYRKPRLNNGKIVFKNNGEEKDIKP